jgi:hypothetical protein
MIMHHPLPEVPNGGGGSFGCRNRADTVLEAAVVSTAELSFLLHAASANAAMVSVAAAYPDPFLNMSFSLPPEPGKAAPFVAASFIFARVSGQKAYTSPVIC